MSEQVIGKVGGWRAVISQGEGAAYKYVIYKPNGDVWAFGERSGANAKKEVEAITNKVVYRMSGKKPVKWNTHPDAKVTD